MKKKVAFIIYRQWAFNIFKHIAEFNRNNLNCEIVLLITTPEHEFSLIDVEKICAVNQVLGKDTEKIYRLLKQYQVDAALFYGWSWIVTKPILDDFLCLGLHPSELPRYRGGTPIQHQILNREKKSAVTIFRMDEGIDSGDIYMQRSMSLSGDINDIFVRMTRLGTAITKRLITDLRSSELQFRSQKNIDNYPPLRRRKPEDSEIIGETVDQTAFCDINNLVRGLLAPFPNAFIKIGDQKVLIQSVGQRKRVSQNDVILNEIAQLDNDMLSSGRPLCLRIKDGYARIKKYTIIRI